MNTKVASVAHPKYSISSIPGLIAGDYSKKIVFYEELLKTPQFRSLQKKYKNEKCNYESKHEKLSSQLCYQIAEETKKPCLNTDYNDFLKSLQVNNEVTNVSPRKQDQLTLEMGIEVEEAADNTHFIETLQEQNEVVASYEPTISSRTVKTVVDLEDGKNKRPMIIEEINEQCKYKFEKTLKTKHQKDYENFSITGQVEFVDKVNKIAVFTRRTSFESIEEAKYTDKITAQCYMELLDYEKCLIVYSNKNATSDCRMKEFLIVKDENSMIVAKLGRITEHIRSLTFQDFKDIYNRYNF
jgi:hypothetical protein